MSTGSSSFCVLFPNFPWFLWFSYNEIHWIEYRVADVDALGVLVWQFEHYFCVSIENVEVRGRGFYNCLKQRKTFWIFNHFEIENPESATNSSPIWAFRASKLSWNHKQSVQKRPRILKQVPLLVHVPSGRPRAAPGVTRSPRASLPRWNERSSERKTPHSLSDIMKQPAVKPQKKPQKPMANTTEKSRYTFVTNIWSHFTPSPMMLSRWTETQPKHAPPAIPPSFSR